MNKKEAERIVKNFELVKAFANGATIQRTDRFLEPKRWVDTPSPLWDDSFEYRVKPEPEEFFITVQGKSSTRAIANGNNTESGDFVGGTYPDLYMAQTHANDWGAGYCRSRIFKVIEVLP